MQYVSLSVRTKTRDTHVLRTLAWHFLKLSDAMLNCSCALTLSGHKKPCAGDGEPPSLHDLLASLAKLNIVTKNLHRYSKRTPPNDQMHTNTVSKDCNFGAHAVQSQDPAWSGTGTQSMRTAGQETHAPDAYSNSGAMGENHAEAERTAPSM